jgi:tRNA-2-methylthio-N6-dimethylallyladenosine synthase
LPYFHIINYGCQMNRSDAEHYAGQLESLGYEEAPSYQDAAVVLLNTCCVRDSAEKKICGKIGELKHFKQRNPASAIVVAGCLAQKDGEALLAKYPQLDLLVGTAYVNAFAEVLQEFMQTRRRAALLADTPREDEFGGSLARQKGCSAWVPVMYGCDNYCSYCIVPYVRGRERSRPLGEILGEVAAAVAGGYKEVTLLGQNVNSYGKGGQGDFASLLRAVDKTPGLARARFMTSHPKDMGEDVIRAVAEGRTLCEHFHLPVQAGGDKILKAMNRGYGKAAYLGLVEKARRYVPEAGLTTDIIVGFPGEAERDFAGFEEGASVFDMDM